MMHRLDKSFFVFFIVPMILDRLTKWAFVSGFLVDSQITSFLELYLTYNSGIAWGIGQSCGQYIAWGMLIIIALVIAYHGWHMAMMPVQSIEYKSSLLILSGALSNFIDRFLYVGVVDFIRFHWGDYSFAVFNLADVWISLGVCLILFWDMIYES